jgi:subtilisin family serine protease
MQRSSQAPHLIPSAGTHCASTIGGTTYGVAKAATIIPVQVLGCSGSGTYSGIIAGIDWVIADVAAQPSGTRAVALLSLGGGFSSMMNAAISRLHAANIPVVVAAGKCAVDAEACPRAHTARPSHIPLCPSSHL